MFPLKMKLQTSEILGNVFKCAKLNSPTRTTVISMSLKAIEVQAQAQTQNQLQSWPEPRVSWPRRNALYGNFDTSGN